MQNPDNCIISVIWWVFFFFFFFRIRISLIRVLVKQLQIKWKYNKNSAFFCLCLWIVLIIILFILAEFSCVYEISFVASPLDSTAQTGQSSGGDWQEQVYQHVICYFLIIFFLIKLNVCGRKCFNQNKFLFFGFP